MKPFFRIFALLTTLLVPPVHAAPNARQLLAEAALTDDDVRRRELIMSVAGSGEAMTAEILEAWRTDQLFIHTTADGARVVVRLSGEKDARNGQLASRVDNGQLLPSTAGAPLRLAAGDLIAVEHTASLRRVMKSVLDQAEIAHADPRRRAQAVKAIGFSQAMDQLPALRSRFEIETDPNVQRLLREAIALIRLASPNDAEKVSALHELQDLHTLSSYDLVAAALRSAKAGSNRELTAAATAAQQAIDRHRSFVDFFGTLFRSASLGSILLVVALGLAITFGLMGVINMAHGEMIAVGAYTTYLTQAVFGAGITLPCFGLSLSVPGLHLSGWAYQGYFLAAIPLSFITAALVGIALERGIIQFLYRRPLESLLATWGVSLVLQQIFRLTFGANNVQVSSPSYLSGNWTVADVLFGWNRVFVIGFAGLIVFGVWLLLARTPLGLLIRAVMQNRTMASCMGVRTERVNMLTFGLGSGLAGLAGAFLSQIGNVGPALGQSYIVDSFMTVVVGGVGNLFGTVISAFGIGALDQVLQQYLPLWAPGLSAFPVIGGFLQNLAQDSSVFGKILVLALIVIFLQWRPAGLFVTRSRSLD